MPITVCELSPAQFYQLNAMCVPSGQDAPAAFSAMRESAEALQQASATGLRVFGAFLNSEPVGRLELSPIEAAPVPLKGQDTWVIRCLWIVEKAKGLGLGRRLMELALDSVGTESAAVLTYEDWMPPAFLEKFGFRLTQRQGEGILMVRPGGQAAGRSAPTGPTPGGPASATRPTPATPEATTISFALVKPSFAPVEPSFAPVKPSFAPVKPSFALLPDCVRVDAVYTPRCPWRIVNVRRRLADARELSDRVVTHEHRIYNREDALRLGEEYTYVDGEPLAGGPMSREVFLRAVTERLRAKGLIPR